MKEAREYYDEFSFRYDSGRDRGYHALIDEIEAGLVAEHRRGGKALEAGCGTGLILERLADICPAAVGVDLSGGMLRRARDRGLTVIQADVTALPFKDAAFDCTFSFKVLAHVRDIDRALEELVRVTRPGGCVLAELYNRLSLRYFARVLKGPRRISRESTDREVYTRYDRWREISRRVPRGSRLVGLRGIRIFTLHPSLIGLPLIGGLLRFLEKRCTKTPLKRFGGFVVLILERIH